MLRKVIILAMIVAGFVGATEVQNNTKDGFEYWIQNSVESPQTTAYLSNKATSIIDVIISSGRYLKLGNLDLVALRKEILNVKWRAYIGKPFTIGNNGARSTAVYSVNRRLVVVSREEWFDMDEAIREEIALHEALGALGYRDEKYQMTMSLALLASLVFSEENKYFSESKIIIDKLSSLWSVAVVSRPVMEIAKTDQTPVVLLAGGISLTGGGGDEFGITIKYLTLLALTTRWSMAEVKHVKFEEVFNAILESDIERTVEEIKLGKPLIDKTTIKYNGKSLAMIVPKNKVIINPRSYTLAGDYAGFLCDEIITTMESFHKK